MNHNRFLHLLLIMCVCNVLALKFRQVASVVLVTKGLKVTKKLALEKGLERLRGLERRVLERESRPSPKG